MQIRNPPVLLTLASLLLLSLPGVRMQAYTTYRGEMGEPHRHLLRQFREPG